MRAGTRAIQHVEPGMKESGSANIVVTGPACIVTALG